MPLVKTTLNTAIKNLFLANMPNPTSEQSSQVDKMAKEFSDAIDSYIKSATITIAAGIPVATAGSPTAQTGATTAPAIATIN